MSQLQLCCTVDEKNETVFKENLCSTYCSPLFPKYPVRISQLPDANSLRYSGPKVRL